jgi:hypothetical protein
VYNFGAEIDTIADELALLRHFLRIYAIDQAIFYTGGNDATNHYMATAGPQGPQLLGGAHAFELIKVAHRFSGKYLPPDNALLARIDNEVLPGLAHSNTLRDGIAAAAYCRTAAMRCDFMLQPMLLTRRNPVGPEVAMGRPSSSSIRATMPPSRPSIEARASSTQPSTTCRTCSTARPRRCSSMRSIPTRWATGSLPNASPPSWLPACSEALPQGAGRYWQPKRRPPAEVQPGEAS